MRRVLPTTVLLLLLFAPTADARWSIVCVGEHDNAGEGYQNDCLTYWEVDPADPFDPALRQFPRIGDGAREFIIGERSSDGLSDPIEGDGEFTQVETDISLPGSGLHYEFTRTYRSRGLYLGDLGYSWDHNYNQKLRLNCDKSVTYFDGHFGAVTFKPDPSDPNAYLPDYRAKLALTTLGVGHYQIDDWKTGYRSIFTDYQLSQIVAPWGASLSVQWGAYYDEAGHTQHHVTSVGDRVTNRTVNYIYSTGKTPLLQCLTFGSDCSDPIVSFHYGSNPTAADANELLMVTKGEDAKGTSYQYHDGELPDSHIPDPALDNLCGSLCGTKATSCWNEDFCNESTKPCAEIGAGSTQLEKVANCVNYYAATCVWQNCDSKADPVEYGGCVDYCKEQADSGQYQQYCWLSDAKYTELKNKCFQYWTNQYPFCSAVTNGNDSIWQCEQTCAAFYRSPNGYTFGQPIDLNHNLVEVDDPAGQVIVKNTYGSDPTDVSFDHVVDQQWGASGHVTFGYHDLQLEAQYRNSTKPPSEPDPAHVLSSDQWQSIQICPPSACNEQGCAPARVDNSDDPPRQIPAYATVIGDVHGVVHTKYFNRAWDLLREVNNANKETTDFNYGHSGGPASDGQIVAIQHPAGDRLCYTRNDAGAPTEILHVPAPGYDGNADWRAEEYTYVGGSRSTTVQTYVADSKGSGKVTYPTGDVRPSSIIVQVDSDMQITTTYQYSSSWLIPDSITTVDGSVVKNQDFDPLAAAPRQTIVDANGPSPLVSYASYDPVFGFLRESGRQGQSATLRTYDSAGRVQTFSRRMDPNQPWDSETIEYVGEAPMHRSDSRRDEYIVPDGPGNPVVHLVKTRDGTVTAASCFHYSPDGRLLETIHAEGSHDVYQYDDAGHVVGIQKGFVSEPVTGWGPWTAYCDKDPKVPPKDPGLETVSASTYSGGFLTSKTIAGIKYQVTTDGFGRVIEEIDPLGRRRRFGYDRLDRMTWTARYVDFGAVPAYGPPAFGQPGLVQATEYSYDNLNRITSTAQWILESGTKHVVSTKYDDANRTITRTEGPKVTVTVLDGAGRVVSETFADDSKATTTYTDNGATASIMRETNRGPQFELRNYDGLGLLQTLTVQGTVMLSETHDIDGHVLTHYGLGEGYRRYDYDQLGRRTADVVGLNVAPAIDGPVTTYGYDLDDRLVSVKDPRNGVYQYVYDGLGRALEFIDSNNQLHSFAYEPGSRRMNYRSLANGSFETFAYDEAGQMIQRTVYRQNGRLHEAIPRSFTYTPLGQIATATTNGNTTTLRYDSLGHLVADSNDFTQASVTHLIDPYGAFDSTTVQRVTSTSTQYILKPPPEPVPYPGPGRSQTTILRWDLNHLFDPLGRLQAVRVNGSIMATFDNGVGSGGPRTVAYKGGALATMSYDELGRWTGVTVDDPTAGQQLSYQDVIGSDGVVRARRRSYRAGPMVTDVFQVDAAGRMTAENEGLSDVPTLASPVSNATVAPYIQAGVGWRSYTPDQLGNWLARTTSGGPAPATYDALNRVTAFSGYSNVTYDDNDRVVAIHDPQGDIAVPVDPSNGLPASITKNGVTTTYTYDALDRRIAEQTGGHLELLIWDGARLVAHGADDTGFVVEAHGQNVDDHVCAMDEAGRAWSYHQSADGSVLGLTDASGKLIEGYSYSAFGEPTVIAPDGTAKSNSSVGNRLRFQGALYDEPSGTYSMRAREYDPRFGKFMSTDPLGLNGGINLYAFVGDAPLAGTDPTGLRRRLEQWAGNRNAADWLKKYEEREDRRRWNALMHGLPAVLAWGIVAPEAGILLLLEGDANAPEPRSQLVPRATTAQEATTLLIAATTGLICEAALKVGPPAEGINAKSAADYVRLKESLTMEEASASTATC